MNDEYRLYDEKNMLKVLFKTTDVSQKWASPTIRWVKLNSGSVSDKDDANAAISMRHIIVVILKFPMVLRFLSAVFSYMKFQQVRRVAIIALDWVASHVKKDMCPSGWDFHPPFPSSWMASMHLLEFPWVMIGFLVLEAESPFLLFLLLVCNHLSIFENYAFTRFSLRNKLFLVFSLNFVLVFLPLKLFCKTERIGGIMEIVLEGDEHSLALTRFMVAGKILANRTLNRWGVVSILHSIWAEDVAPCIQEIGANMFGISFRSEKLRENALAEGPWNIMGFCMVFRNWDQGVMIEELDFCVADYWVQIHNLPIEMLTRSNGELIGKNLGIVKAVEEPISSGGLGRSFLRIRLGIEVCKPLVPGFWVPRRNKEKVWAMVRYEKLVDFCFTCGKLGHVEKQCHMEPIVVDGQSIWGPHLRAAPIKRAVWNTGSKDRKWGRKEASGVNTEGSRKNQYEDLSKSVSVSERRTSGGHDQNLYEGHKVQYNVKELLSFNNSKGTFMHNMDRPEVRSDQNRRESCHSSSGDIALSSFHGEIPNLSHDKTMTIVVSTQIPPDNLSQQENENHNLNYHNSVINGIEEFLDGTPCAPLDDDEGDEELPYPTTPTNSSPLISSKDHNSLALINHDHFVSLHNEPIASSENLSQAIVPNSHPTGTVSNNLSCLPYIVSMSETENPDTNLMKNDPINHSTGVVSNALPSPTFYMYDKNLHTYIPVRWDKENVSPNMENNAEDNLDALIRLKKSMDKEKYIAENSLSAGLRKLDLKRDGNSLEWRKESDPELKRVKIDKSLQENKTTTVKVEIQKTGATQKGERKGSRRVQSGSRRGRRGVVVWSRTKIEEMCLYVVPVSETNVVISAMSSLGPALTLSALKYLNKKYSPDFVFLMETRNCQEFVNKVGKSLRFKEGVIVDPIGLSGGLVLWWKENLVVNIVEMNKNFIDIFVDKGDGSGNYRITWIYGAPSLEERRGVWDKIKMKAIHHTDAWLCMGDMNDILDEGEKEGGRRKERWAMRSFREMFEQCESMEVPTKGQRFTWSGIREGVLVKERLDRAMVNLEWMIEFPKSTVLSLPAIGSDHSPLIFNTDASDLKGVKKFRFEAVWLEDVEVKKIIEKGWDGEISGSNASQVVKKLKHCKDLLIKWQKDKAQNKKKIDNFKKAIADVQDHGEGIEDAECVKDMQQQLQHLWREEEIYWHQRARVSWLNCGDKNTQFFHQSTLQRRQYNKILRIKDDNGDWIDKEEVILEKFCSHYEGLFTSEYQGMGDLDLSCVPKLVTDEMNMDLLKEVTMAEVKDVVFQIGSLKSPGPDGSNGQFYHRFWDIVKGDLFKMVRSFMHSGRMLRELNQTEVVLIPKVKVAEDIGQFRPISLCNVAYKVISKVLVNRLKERMDKIISENQSAFIAGRQIFDNVLIAQEAFHHIRLKKKGKKGVVAMKIDINRAYDRVEYIISRLIQVGVNNGDIHGVKLSRNCPVLSHLFFADDSLFFLEANIVNCRKMFDLIQDNEMIIHWRSWDCLTNPKGEGGLGFRELEDFNKALLAKQVWRLINEPEALWAKFLRGIYFSNGDVMSAKKGARASWTWSSLLEGRDFLRDKLLWQVGDGSKINVLVDKWIPGLERGVEENSWDTSALGDRGHYIVKSGYHSLREKSRRSVKNDKSSSSHVIPADLWKEIWKTKCPPKVRMFLWRCAQNAVATNQALHRRNCKDSMVCGICHSYDESIEHLLLLCDWTRVVWFGVCGLHFDLEKITTFDDWFLKICHSLDEKGDIEGNWRMRVAFTCWYIWKSRCEAVFNKCDINPDLVVMRINRAIQEFEWAEKQKFKLDCPRTMGREEVETKWIKPPDGWLKVNSDGSFCSKIKSAGIGIVSRNHHGQVLDATGKKVHCYDALAAEALALKEAVSKVAGQALDNVIFETDSIELLRNIKAVNEGSVHWRIRPIVQDIKEALNLIDHKEVAYISRMATLAADWFARQARKGMSCATWREHQPSSLTGIWSKDGVPAPPSLVFSF
ncbi:reverse transcriptase [Corchorus capsularis]|uniref:Reverse transcriptase n=1 Tax=Corchorus capsularis TaxID=210143 RepID=A0A1R3G1P7_COCAP|nr:reverse transcriptase [Corchorus capsularis]